MITDSFNGEYDQVLIYDRQNLGAGRSRKTIFGKHIVIVADIGGGKTTAQQTLLEELYDHKHTIIGLTDEKDQVELGCVMFEPEEEYHINKLKMEGRSKRKLPAKLYHPFTFNIPNGLLPEVRFFTISVKTLIRSILAVLTETLSTSEAVNLCLRAAGELRKDEGLYSFLQRVDRYIQDHEKKYRGKSIDSYEETFLTSGKMAGTKKELGQVISMFQPFIENALIMPDDFPLNLDFTEVINDQEHYHIFFYKWLADEKLKYFSKMAVMEGIYASLDRAKYRVAFDIDEIAALIPDKPVGYKKIAADLIRHKLRLIRSKGKGVITASCAQVFFDIDEGTRNLLKYKHLGRLGVGDIERLSKIYNWGQSTRAKLAKMPIGQFISPSLPSQEPHTTLMPQHSLAEEGKDFFSQYRKYYRDRMRTADQEKAMVKEVMEKDKAKVKALKDEEIRRQKEAIKREDQEKKERQEEKEKEERKPAGPLNKTPEAVIQLIVQAKLKDPKISYRKLAKDFNISHPTVKKILKEHLEKATTSQHQDSPLAAPVEQSLPDAEVPSDDVPIQNDLDG